MRIITFKQLGLLVAFSFGPILSLKADEAALQRQINNLENTIKSSHETCNLEKLRLRQAAAEKRQTELKILMGSLKEQLARYNLQVTLGGAEGELLIVSPLPDDKRKLAEQGKKVATHIEKLTNLLQAKQGALDNAQSYYNALPRDSRENWVDNLVDAEREKDNAAFALETAQAAEIAINQLIDSKYNTKEK